MKLIIIILICFFFFNNSPYQDTNSKLEGKWKLTNEIECPDFIIFNPNNTYLIFNDCGSIDPKYPIVEKGVWRYENKNSSIIFSDREFISPNSIFSNNHGYDSTLWFYLKNITDEKMELCYINKENDFMYDHYVKVK